MLKFPLAYSLSISEINYNMLLSSIMYLQNFMIAHLLSAFTNAAPFSVKAFASSYISEITSSPSRFIYPHNSPTFTAASPLLNGFASLYFGSIVMLPFSSANPHLFPILIAVGSNLSNVLHHHSLFEILFHLFIKHVVFTIFFCDKNSISKTITFFV